MFLYSSVLKIKTQWTKLHDILLMFIPVGNFHSSAKISAFYASLLIERKLLVLKRWFFSLPFVSYQWKKGKYYLINCIHHPQKWVEALKFDSNEKVITQISHLKPGKESGSVCLLWRYCPLMLVGGTFFFSQAVQYPGFMIPRGKKKRVFVLNREFLWTKVSRTTCWQKGSTGTHTVCRKLVYWETDNATAYAYVCLPSIIYF